MSRKRLMMWGFVVGLFLLFSFGSSLASHDSYISRADRIEQIDAAARRGGEKGAEFVFSFFRDGDMRVRTYALSRLVEMGETAVPVLVNHIGDEDIRWLVSGALINIGEKAIPALMEVLKKGDENEVRNALFIIGQIGSRRAFDAVRELVDRGLPSIRPGAVRVLGKLSGPDDISLFVDLLASDDDEVRDAAIEVMGNMGEIAVPHLVGVFETGSVKERVGVLRALETIHSDVSFRILLEGLRDVDPAVRFQACVSLGEFGREDAIDELVRLFNDNVSYVRNAAVDAVAELIGEKNRIIGKLLEDGNSTEKICAATVVRKRKLVGFSRILCSLLKDLDPGVRIASAAALIELEDPETIEPLVDALKDNQVRWFAVLALKRFGYKDIRPLLSRTGDGELNYWKQYVLEQMGEMAIEGCVRAIKESKDLGVKVSSICTLSQIRSTKAIYPLVKLLADEKLRDVVSYVLEKVGPDSTDPLIVGLSDDDPAVRMESARILGKIGDQRALRALMRLVQEEKNESVREVAVAALNSITCSGE